MRVQEGFAVKGLIEPDFRYLEIAREYEAQVRIASRY